MKKLMAIVLICALILSMAACGKKENSAPDTQSQNAGSSQTGSVTPTDGNGKDSATTPTDGSAESTAPSEESTAPSEDPTEPSRDPGKEDTAVKDEPNKGETDKDGDIKVELDNNGTVDTPVITPSDGNDGNSFVIDFDDLLEASKK